MEDLRRPLFLVAVALLVVAFLIEIGGAAVLRGVPLPDGKADQFLSGDALTAYNQLDQGQKDEFNTLAAERPPGLGVPYLALLDGVLLFTVALMGISLLIPERVHARIQGIATLIFALLLIIVGIVLILVAIVRLLVMVTLLASVPFGTLAYLAIYGFFNRGGASVALSLLMLLTLGFAGSLILAQQRFLQNKGLVAMIVTLLIGIIVVGFLHGFVPLPLVSIADAIAAIVVAILAVIWAILLLIGSLVSVGKAVRLKA